MTGRGALGRMGQPTVYAVEDASYPDALSRLAELLCVTLDNAPSNWRRKIIERALADVRAYAEER
jgi:hypothetical protein